MADPAPVSLPREVEDLARRLGACQSGALSAVTLEQCGSMCDRPGGRKFSFRARQRIDLRRPGFEWRARTGPFGCIGVLDELREGRAELAVRLFGCIRLAGVRGGEMAAKGEVMRYLAELAWAPDAIVRNASLDWTITDGQTLRVGSGSGRARGEVELQLDDHGRIHRVLAQDRPRKEGSGFVERPWRGRFFDYRRHAGRWLPFAGEVGWLLDECFVAWRGTLLSWSIG